MSVTLGVNIQVVMVHLDLLVCVETLEQQDPQDLMDALEQMVPLEGVVPLGHQVSPDLMEGKVNLAVMEHLDLMVFQEEQGHLVEQVIIFLNNLSSEKEVYELLLISK